MSEGRFVLHGRPGSGSSAVEAVLRLTGLPHETVYVRKTEDGSLPQEIRDINPLGQVPVLLLPDGQVMTESGAILMYLAEQVPQLRLAPAPGDADRPAFLRLMLFMATNTYMTDLRYYYPHRYAGGQDHAAAVVAKAIAEQERNWSALESMAATKSSLLLSGLSVADLYLAMLASWSQIEGFSNRWPKLHSIARNVAAMPGLAEIWKRNDVAF